MLNILIAEDDDNILKLMEIRLKQNGFFVLAAADGKTALSVIENNKVDLMIVDISMPHIDGLELIRIVRESGNQMPAIIVSARGRLSDKTQGFLAGIDDYMVKPIEFDELLFRIKALLKRAKIFNDKQLKVGDTVLDCSTLTVSDSLLTVNLTKREFSILFKLLSYSELSFTKGQLFDEFWGYLSTTDEDAVKVYINRIRIKIKEFPEIDIETIRGVGYRGVKHERK